MSHLGRRDSGDVAGGGGGGGVTPEELAVVAAQAQAAQATADSKVARVGDTMTGALTAPQLITPGNFEKTKECSPVTVYRSPVDNVTGTIGIKLPPLTEAVMLLLEVTMFQYVASRSANKIMISGFFNPTAGTVAAVSAISFDTFSVGNVRIAYDGANFRVLLGVPTSVWRWPLFSVKTLSTYGELPTNPDLWGVSILNVVDENAISYKVNVTVNNGLTPDSRFAPIARGRITNTYGGFSLQYGDLAVTKVSTGLYSITFSTADPRKLMFFPESVNPVKASSTGTSGTSELTLRMWDQAGVLTNAVGDLYIWT